MDTARTEQYRTLCAEIGHTPLYEIKNIAIPNGNRIFAKEEYLNPTGSHYDRVFVRLFEGLEEEGVIRPGQDLVETTSGNAGASFAWLCATLGYRGTVLIPADMPGARIAQIRSFGVEVLFSPAAEYVSGLIGALRTYLHVQKDKGRAVYCLNHAESPYSVEGVHSCGREIMAQLRDRGIEVPHFFLAALGGGIHARGISDVLAEEAPSAQIIGVEPFEAPENYLKRYPTRFERIYGVPPMLRRHQLLGIGRWGDTSYEFPNITSLLPRLSDIMLVKHERWSAVNQQLRNVEAKFVGHTSAASLAAALDLCATVRDCIFVIVFYDPAWKYLGTGDDQLSSRDLAPGVSGMRRRQAAARASSTRHVSSTEIAISPPATYVPRRHSKPPMHF